MKAREIMIKKVKTIYPEQNIIDAFKMFAKYDFHALPVVNKERKIIGIITESDFFTHSAALIHLPTYIDFLKKAKFKSRINEDEKKNISGLLNAKVADIMNKNCLTVSADEEIGKLIKIFKLNKIYSLPVIDKEKKVIGIITQADIILLLTKKYGQKIKI